MAKEVDQIRVGANGTIRVAPVGTTAPTDEIAAYAAGWVDLGFTNEDGVTLTDEKTLFEIPVWQLFYPARRGVSGRNFTAAFVLRQWSIDTVKLALAATVTEPTPGHYKIVPPSPENIDQRALGIDWIDGTKHYRLIIPRGMVTENVSTKIARANAADLPVTFGIIGDDAAGDPWTIYTDDPAFEAA